MAVLQNNGSQQEELSALFTKLIEYVEYEVHEDRIDMGRLTQSLTKKLSDAMDHVNPAHKQSKEEEEQKRADGESDKKLNNIEVELEEIANGVRENLQSIFQRGEKFDSLTQKSEQLKSVSSTLKKRATKIRQQSEGWGIWSLLSSLLCQNDNVKPLYYLGGFILFCVIV